MGKAGKRRCARYSAYFMAGAVGFMGGHLAPDLLLKSHEVVALDVKPLEEWFPFNTGTAI